MPTLPGEMLPGSKRAKFPPPTRPHQEEEQESEGTWAESKVSEEASKPQANFLRSFWIGIMSLLCPLRRPTQSSPPGACWKPDYKRKLNCRRQKANSYPDQTVFLPLINCGSPSSGAPASVGALT